MEASHLHTFLALCSRENWRTVRESRCFTPLPVRLATRKGRAFCVRASSGPYAMAASTLQGQVETLEKAKDSSGSSVSSIEIRTLQDCRLGIAMYPDFVYNADGGGGPGSAEQLPDGILAVEFNMDELFIPAVEWRTTRFLGLPLPPFLCINVVPQALKGTIDRATGQVQLAFSANFLFSVGSLYRAPPLVVNTLLTTETVAGRLRRGQGRRLNAAGQCRLVGVAPLAPIEDAFMNFFLTLPTDCLASMEAKFIFAT